MKTKVRGFNRYGKIKAKNIFEKKVTGKFGGINNGCIFAPMNEIKVTEDEKKWVKLLSEGNKSADVAAMVNVNPSTFAYRMSLLRARFNCSNTAALIATFSKNGLID